MRFFRAYSTMMRLAFANPGWAISAALAKAFTPTGLKVLLAYLGVVIIGGFWLSLKARELGFEPQTLSWSILNIFFTLSIPLGLLLLCAPLILLHFGDIQTDTHGSARFATDKEVSPLVRTDNGLLMGRDAKTGKILRYAGPSHLLTMAPTRTGKGVGTIIPNLLTADRSIVCIDPKGENAKIASRARERFGPVHVLDPFGVTGIRSSAYNPLDILNPDGLDVAEDASTLADALVVDEPGMTGEAHWNEEAKALISGLILRIVAVEPPTRRHLGTLREYLTLAPERFAAVLKEMQDMNEAGGLIARAANRHLGKSDREAAGVLSAAQRHTHFLDSPRMNRVLDESYFSFADLKRRNTTVFLVLPPDRLSTYSRWLRLLVTQSLLDMARTPEKPHTPVLYLLDEFAALGYLAPVERAMGLMAGYGVQLWPILQDVHQLRSTYGQKAGTFLSNAGVLQVFGVNDHDSARLVSELLGQETVVFRTMAHSVDSEQSGITYSQHHTARPLLTSDEIRTLPSHVQLLFLAGRRPIVAHKLRYYSDAEFQGTFDIAS
ncbi:type IV secretory system conjugative DNA transfer family protein [Pseudorhizobium flavum]|uniref:Type IV secretion system protein VirD4 n=1 Tax=Pseudorhizobium flavum TaxID=1335061 RepID=A0A7W9Z395_9HYPH|nr:type IV secretory system conjugative DNA transfer family protein [Pseudorhizobium flavum]MBB6182356.1 type IV secretion system protein VirD4 [Pseudorhizobium flavum]CAD6630192.1 conjugal transfer protein TraG [Pseudorhizobium flavum]